MSTESKYATYNNDELHIYESETAKTWAYYSISVIMNVYNIVYIIHNGSNFLYHRNTINRNRKSHYQNFESETAKTHLTHVSVPFQHLCWTAIQ